jgi:hypothetical protein
MLGAMAGGAAFSWMEGGEVFFLAAAGWVAAGFWRLIRGHAKLKRAAAAVLSEVGDEKRARAILFRMTDEEVERMASGGRLEEWKERSCLRWRLIRASYIIGPAR